MLGWMRELPDGAMGVALAGTVWFGAAYWLADRAMEAEATETLLPACLSQLEAEQDRALERARSDAEEDRAYRVGELQSTIRRKESQLREVQTALAQYRELRQLYDGSGLGMIVPMPSAGLPTQEDLNAIRTQINEAKAALANLPPISLPRVPSEELRQTCTCAMMQSLGSKRTDYAISLASFRLITPKAMTSAKSDMAHALRWDGCGAKPWEEL